jgi:hypothetical protein
MRTRFFVVAFFLGFFVECNVASAFEQGTFKQDHDDALDMLQVCVCVCVCACVCVRAMLLVCVCAPCDTL